MTTRTPRSRPGWRAALATAAVLVLGSALPAITAAPASAHKAVASSYPSAGQHLDIAPQLVSVQFTEDVLTTGATILVVGDDEENHVTGAVSLSGSTVTAPLADGLEDGVYEVRWRVVLSDGHTVSSTFPFSVGEAEALEPTEAVIEETPAPADGSQGAASDAAGSGAGAPADLGRIVIIAAAGAIGALAIWFGVLSWRKRRNPVGKESS